LDLSGGRVKNGNSIQLWECNGEESQQWFFHDWAIFYAADPSKCIDITGGESAMRTQGTKLQIWDCNGLTNQNWGYDAKLQTIYAAKTAGDASMCMDLGGDTVKDHAVVQIWGCNGHTNQNWKWCSDGRIVSEMNENMCLDVPGGDFSKSQRLQIWACNSNQGQYWKYDSKSMSVYPAQIGEKMCMDVENDSRSPGARVNLYYCHPGTGVAWKTASAASNFSVPVDFVTV